MNIIKKVCYYLLILCGFNLNSQSYGPFTPGTVVNVGRGGSNSDLGGLGNLTTDNNVYCFNNSNLGGSGDYTDYFYATNFGFSVNATYTVTGIEVIIQRRDVNGNCKDDIVRLLKAGALVGANRGVNSAWPSADADMTYGSSSDLWGTTWTPAQISASNFGVAMSWVRSGGGSGAALGQVDRVQIIVYYSVPLPIELTYFNANCIDENNVELRWNTASERNNKTFTIERSIDAINFKSIAEISGSGSQTKPTNYQYIDTSANPNKNILYYHLKQTDLDGTTRRHNLIMANCLDKESVLNVFPNPAVGEISLQNLPDDANSIEIIGSKGEILRTYYLEHNSKTVDLNGLEKGLYLIKITTPYKTQIAHFIKE